MHLDHPEVALAFNPVDHCRRELGTYHLSRSNESFFEDQEWLGAKIRWLPDHQIGQFSNLNTTNQMADSLGECRVNRIFAYIAFNSVVICPEIFVFW